MVFSSLIFLYAYLPLTLLCYYFVPQKLRNLVLFAFSLLFYGWGEPIYVVLMALSITTAYLFGFLIERYKPTNPKRAKTAMIASVAVNLSFLLFFKYYNFFAENLSLLPFVNVPVIDGLKLPIGISFYTFQIISYTVDVYRNDCRAQRNYVSFGTYVTLFPQLIAGPIVRYRDVDRALSERRETVDDFSAGVSRFCCGLAKKVLIGDMLAAGYEYYKTLAEFQPTALGAWMTIILYTLHLYYDFSGYSDMAIGLGRMLGFHFPENFNYPYVAKSITEFWRRWHISLSTWFREYVYIPLGGNRKGRLKTYRNLAVVWLLTGFWHGASWNFVLWGVYYLAILILEKAFFGRILEKIPSVFRHFYTMLLVTLGFLIFSFTDVATGWHCFCSLVGGGGAAWFSSVALYQLLRLLPLVLIAAVGATPLPRMLFERLTARFKWGQILIPVLSAAALLLTTAYLVDSTYSPFAYTQF
ncbi:MAG: MBOAT family protein [Ruminococcaceae bacterium]|nr:MBOAT family protein [Oscillospiraceae bacterium]